MSPVDDGFVEYEAEPEDKNDPEDFDGRRHSWEDESVVVKRHSEQWNNGNNESRNGIVLNPSSIMDNDDRY